MINEQYARAKKILEENKEGHNQLTMLLIEKEVIFAEDLENIFGKRPWKSRSEEIMAAKESKDAAEAERKLEERLKKELDQEMKEKEAQEIAEKSGEEVPATAGKKAEESSIDEKA